VRARVRTLAVPLGLAAAFWPVWRWYLARLGDGGDERWGLLAVAAIAILARRPGPTAAAAEGALPVVCIGVATYAIAFPLLPPLGRAALAVSALGVYLSRRRFGRLIHLGVLGLLLLALPVEATVQFVLGYPLRALVARSSAGLLGLGGVAARPEGTGLVWAGETVLVDAPCSGVRMLWAGLLLALILAVLLGLSNPRTLALTTVAVVLLLVANVLRATALFILETGVLTLPRSAHEMVGAAAFSLAAGAVTWAAFRLARRSPCAT
jgi:exosortase